MDPMEQHWRKGLAVLRGEPNVTVTMDDVVNLLQLTQPQGAFVDTSFGECFSFGAKPTGPNLGRAVHWPDGSVSHTAGPHVPKPWS